MGNNSESESEYSDDPSNGDDPSEDESSSSYRSGPPSSPRNLDLSAEELNVRTTPTRNARTMRTRNVNEICAPLVIREDEFQDSFVAVQPAQKKAGARRSCRTRPPSERIAGIPAARQNYTEWNLNPREKLYRPNGIKGIRSQRKKTQATARGDPFREYDIESLSEEDVDEATNSCWPRWKRFKMSFDDVNYEAKRKLYSKRRARRQRNCDVGLLPHPCDPVGLVNPRGPFVPVQNANVHTRDSERESHLTSTYSPENSGSNHGENDFTQGLAQASSEMNSLNIGTMVYAPADNRDPMELLQVPMDLSQSPSHSVGPPDNIDPIEPFAVPMDLSRPFLLTTDAEVKWGVLCNVEEAVPMELSQTTQTHGVCGWVDRSPFIEYPHTEIMTRPAARPYTPSIATETQSIASQASSAFSHCSSIPESEYTWKKVGVGKKRHKKFMCMSSINGTCKLYNSYWFDKFVNFKTHHKFRHE